MIDDGTAIKPRKTIEDVECIVKKDLHRNGLQAFGHREVVLHIVGCVDGVHRRLHRFFYFPQFPLHGLFVKLIEICHRSFYF